MAWICSDLAGEIANQGDIPRIIYLLADREAADRFYDAHRNQIGQPVERVTSEVDRDYENSGGIVQDFRGISYATMRRRVR